MAETSKVLENVLNWLRAGYRRVLDRTVKRWQAIAAGSAALLVVALAAVSCGIALVNRLLRLKPAAPVR